ncbi:MAG: hypothetical protein CML16_18210 [Pusillimonas sp.]|nr:hypothetical protein [Pusillimonas sp.]MBC43730.1 hypothetical protein [Pusillimonas sp.]HCP77322.1 hypothetical protein [Pusillimonas sp.]|tara:strand:- start:21539 stop:22390 length:852 start_codon:yes stop_codon:yes gene_type:complete
MKKPLSPLDLPIPKNQTALMQHLQLLVGREEHRYWCGGTVPIEKLEAFVYKMAERYPITRNARGRVYDRKRGIAVVHFIVFPVKNGIAWWLLSSTGKGGLADPAMPDFHVSHDAMETAHHIEFEDYVLLYAHKPAGRQKPGRPADVRRGLSTWTWKIRSSTLTELKAGIEREARLLAYGDDGLHGRRPWGLRGLLAYQRQRPLFSGVRNQVIELHRFARDTWEQRRPVWKKKYPEHTSRYGENAGALMPLQTVMQQHLPTMSRIKIFGSDPTTIQHLCPAAMR